MFAHSVILDVGDTEEKVWDSDEEGMKSNTAHENGLHTNSNGTVTQQATLSSCGIHRKDIPTFLAMEWAEKDLIQDS
jgi:putative NADPH-quinone reductase